MSDTTGQPAQGVSFLTLFLAHWDAGTRFGKPRRGPWTVKEFRGVLADGGCAVSEDAVGNWRNGVNIPRRPQLLAILDAFFLVPCAETSARHADWQRLYEAWAEGTRPGARRERRQIDDAPVAAPHEWPRQNPPPSPGPAALELFTPLPDNQGGYRLRARLDLTAREDESTDKPIRIALREAFVTLELSDNLASDGSLIGKREKHENLVPDGGAVKVVGPRAEDGTLKGEAFQERYIATVTPTDDAKGTATLRVAAGRRGFAVSALDAEGAPIALPGAEARDAVLNLLFFEKLTRDEAGRAVLQKAVLTRPAKE